MLFGYLWQIAVPILVEPVLFFSQGVVLLHGSLQGFLESVLKAMIELVSSLHNGFVMVCVHHLNLRSNFVVLCIISLHGFCFSSLSFGWWWLSRRSICWCFIFIILKLFEFLEKIAIVNNENIWTKPWPLSSCSLREICTFHLRS